MLDPMDVAIDSGVRISGAVFSCPPPAPPALSLSPSQVIAGAPLTISVSAPYGTGLDVTASIQVDVISIVLSVDQRLPVPLPQNPVCGTVQIAVPSPGRYTVLYAVATNGGTPVTSGAAPLTVIASSQFVAFRPIYVDPACPTPADIITVRVTPGPSRIDRRMPPVLSRDGSTISAVLSTTGNGFSEPQRLSAGTLGRLPAGTYMLDFFALDSSATARQFVATTTFVVRDDPPACEARYVRAQSEPVVSGTSAQPYPSGFRVQVVDAHGKPVAGVPVRWERIRSPGDPPPATVDRTGIVSGNTDASGMQAFVASAQGGSGTSQYRAFIDYADVTPSAYFIVRNQPLGLTSAAPVRPVVEYSSNNGLQNFFMTANSAEMAKLDAEGSGWVRTGGLFFAYAADSPARPANASRVCRFYALPAFMFDAHFYSASTEECDAVKLRFGDTWLLETDDAFAVLLPDTSTGSCPSGTVPVHRLYSNRPDGAHRYAIGGLTALLPYASVQYGPWIPEGYGPQAVVMCSPQ